MLDYSIITVCKNSDRTIDKCIQSVNEQQGVNVEHIFIDGLSEDETINKIKRKSKVKNTIISERDNGIYDAMNKGISLSSGKYISILNSDDYFKYENCLYDVKSIFENQQSDIVYSGIKYIDKNYRVSRVWMPSEFYYGKFEKGWSTPHPGFFVKKDIYDELGKFDLSFGIASDYEIMVRFMENKQVKSTRLHEFTIMMRNDGVSSNIVTRVFIYPKIFRALKKNNIKVNFPLIIFSRIFTKLLQINFFKSRFYID